MSLLSVATVLAVSVAVAGVSVLVSCSSAGAWVDGASVLSLIEHYQDWSRP